MTLKEILESKLRDAMRAGDDVTKRTIRLAISAIKNTEIDKGQALDDAGIVAILQKEIKIRTEAIQDAEKAKRDDLISDAKAEMAVLESFLPKQLGESELEALVKEAISECQASSPADMGKVMKAVMPKIQGRAAGDKISQIVRRLLLPG